MSSALKRRLTAWQTLVVIRVEDVNDNVPAWKHLSQDGRLMATIDWTMPVGSIVYRLQVSCSTFDKKVMSENHTLRLKEKKYRNIAYHKQDLSGKPEKEDNLVIID